jgi:amylosucrase
VAKAELESLPDRDQDIFLTRLGRYWKDLYSGLKPPYGNREDFEDFLYRLVRLLATAYAARSEELKLLDLERSLGAGWFQSERRIGYVFYVDRFAGDLRSIHKRIDYLEELGANYLHLMPLLEKRPGPNDGGYAVQNYRSVDPSLGTMEDLEELCTLFRSRGMSVCLDLVLNHCAREHEWAVRARVGEEEYLQMFHTFPDRTRSYIKQRPSSPRTTSSTTSAPTAGTARSPTSPTTTASWSSSGPRSPAARHR